MQNIQIQDEYHVKAEKWKRPATPSLLPGSFGRERPCCVLCMTTPRDDDREIMTSAYQGTLAEGSS